MAILVLHEELQFELPVAGTLGDATRLELLKRLRHHALGIGVFQAERVALRLILDVHLLQHLIHHAGERLCLLLRGKVVIISRRGRLHTLFCDCCAAWRPHLLERRTRGKLIQKVIVELLEVDKDDEELRHKYEE